jgi:8-oxo-dGTP diphosphatase
VSGQPRTVTVVNDLLTVKAGRLLKARSGFQYRVEIYYEAEIVGGLDGLEPDQREVLDARLFHLSALPERMSEAHRELATGL